MTRSRTVASLALTSCLWVSAALPAQARTDWLRCWRGGDVDWPRLRVTLESYADKHLHAPHRFTEEAQIAFIYAHKPLTLPGAAPCPLGDLSLRLFMWLFIEDDKLKEALERSPDFAHTSKHTSQEPAALLVSVLMALLQVPLSWAELLQAGWPLFSIVAQIGQRARLVSEAAGARAGTGDECAGVTTWTGKSYLRALENSFETGALLPAHASVAVLLGVDRTACPVAFACGLLALADSVRWDSTDAGLGPDGGYNAPYYRHTAMAPHAEDDQRTMFTDLHEFVGVAPSDDLTAMVSAGERAVQDFWQSRGQDWLKDLLLTRWPLWRLLDRLSCSEWVNVRTKPAAPTAATRLLRSVRSSFFIHVFPHRVYSDGLQSSITRARRQPYCAVEFQNELDSLRLRRGRGARLRVVEAGPHLGDCMLWAAARMGCSGRLHMTGYDVMYQLAALMRKSIQRNEMASCLDVRLACLMEDVSTVSPFAGVPAVSLDSEVNEHVDLLKVHTNGLEDAILRGGRRLFSERGFGVDVVVVNSASWEVLLRCAEFLLSLPSGPYELEVKGETLDVRKLEEALQQATQHGSAQLVARHPGLQPEPGLRVNASLGLGSW